MTRLWALIAALAATTPAHERETHSELCLSLFTPTDTGIWSRLTTPSRGREAYGLSTTGVTYNATLDHLHRSHAIHTGIDTATPVGEVKPTITHKYTNTLTENTLTENTPIQTVQSMF